MKMPEMMSVAELWENLVECNDTAEHAEYYINDVRYELEEVFQFVAAAATRDKAVIFKMETTEYVQKLHALNIKVEELEKVNKRMLSVIKEYKRNLSKMSDDKIMTAKEGVTESAEKELLAEILQAMKTVDGLARMHQGGTIDYDKIAKDALRWMKKHGLQATMAEDRKPSDELVATREKDAEIKRLEERLATYESSDDEIINLLTEDCPPERECKFGQSGLSCTECWSNHIVDIRDALK